MDRVLFGGGSKICLHENAGVAKKGGLQKREGSKKGCKFHVHDTKEIEGAWAGLVDWITNYFFPLNYEHGLRYNISIISPDLFSKLSSIELQKRSNDRVKTVLCETISQAEAWLTKRYTELSS